MGGAIPTGTGIPEIDKGLNVASFMPALARTYNGINTMQRAPGEARDAMEKASAKQAADAARLEQMTLQQPKTISPDNFLEEKARSLSNLRLGLASTITRTGGAPSAVLSAPSLTPSGAGKSKLGS